MHYVSTVHQVFQMSHMDIILFFISKKVIEAWPVYTLAFLKKQNQWTKYICARANSLK